MTLLATRLACLEIPVNPIDLYYSEDQMLFVWLDAVCDQVEAAHRAANRKGKR